MKHSDDASDYFLITQCSFADFQRFVVARVQVRTMAQDLEEEALSVAPTELDIEPPTERSPQPTVRVAA